MAKYTVLMSCGHEDTVDLFGKTADRERKIEYYKSSGLCKECYKKKMEKQTELEEFTFNASVLPYINEDDGEILLFVWFRVIQSHIRTILSLWAGIDGVKENLLMIYYLYIDRLCVGIKSLN